MGYFIKQIDSKFRIANNNILAALQSLKVMAKNKKDKGEDLDWIYLDSLINAITFNEAIRHCGWFAYVDHKGNVIDMHFSEKKLGDDFLILKNLAPYVESGSYIDIEGEVHDIWRWLFKDGTLKDIDTRSERTIEKIREILYDLSSEWVGEQEEKANEDLRSKLAGINDWKFLDNVLYEIQKQFIYNFSQLYKKINAYNSITII